MNTPFSEQPQTPGRPDLPQQRTKRLGAVIVLTALVLASACATWLVLGTAHSPAHASGGAPTPTPTASTPAPGQPQPRGSLYTAVPGSLSRIDLKTGKAVWSIQASLPSAPLVIGQTLFFENEDSAQPFLEAASVKTGAQLWRMQQYPSGFLLGSRNELYDSFCDPSAVSDPCHLDGINASTGALLWSYDLPQGNAWIALQNGVLYGVSYTSYFALEASTGTPLWQKNLLNYPDQEANMTPVVSGQVLSFASCNTTKQSSGFAGCYLYAFNASNGIELWHLATTASLEATPTIMRGVVYAGAVDGTLYAASEQNGTLLWSANAGGTIGQLLSSAGIIYVETIGSDGQTLHVTAFDAATHTPRWGQVGVTGQSSGAPALLAYHSALSAGPAAFPFALVHGLIYIQSGSTSIAVLSAADGSQVAQYPVTGPTLDGFTVAS